MRSLYGALCYHSYEFKTYTILIQIPENLTDFLYWVKERTETFWSVDPDSSTADFTCDKRFHGAKWIGLKAEEIDAIEEKYDIKFTPEHRVFLSILHTLDRKLTYEEKVSFEEDAEVIVEEYSFFYNWQEDEVEIADKLNWPYRTILQDVQGRNGVWLKSWGPRPSSEEEKTAIFSAWLDKAPKLLPIFSHRFVVSDTTLVDRPILSVWGSDIIVYGWNLRHYLLCELTDHLNLLELVYDEEDECNYSEDVKAVTEIRKFEYSKSKERELPYWKELILYWSSGWSSFGMEYPRKDDSLIQPIVRADPSESEEQQQKVFNGFG